MKISTSLSSLLLSLVLPALVSSHGYVGLITVDGSQSFKGNSPYVNPTASAIRQVTGVEPVKGANNPDINCGLGSKVASDVIKVNPGDKLALQWRGGDGSHWPHNTGPMMTYMASCGSQSCNEFDTTKAKWFKIEQTGRIAAGQEWVQSRLLNDNAPANVTLPSNIAPGNYILRHEILALHLAETMGGAEFYPSCAQLEVGGSRTGAPTDDELVSFPGAYSDTDPGILDKNVYDFNAPYTFPGPPVAKFAIESGAAGDSGSSSGSNSGSGSSGSGSNSGSDPSSNGSSSSGSSSGNKTCKLKQSASAQAKRNLATYKPRHISRIMRNLHLSGLSIH